MENFNVVIEGKDLSIVKMLEKEILIQGVIEKVIKR